MLNALGTAAHPHNKSTQNKQEFYWSWKSRGSRRTKKIFTRWQQEIWLGDTPRHPLAKPMIISMKRANCVGRAEIFNANQEYSTKQRWKISCDSAPYLKLLRMKMEEREKLENMRCLYWMLDIMCEEICAILSLRKRISRKFVRRVNPARRKRALEQPKCKMQKSNR